MVLIKRVAKFLSYYLNFKSIYINFKTLPFKQAIKLPIHCASNVKFRRLSGKIIIRGNLFFRGMIEIGHGDVTHIDKSSPKTNLDITGTLIFNGPAHIGYGSSIRVEGELEIGAQFRITARSTIIAVRKIIIGNNCLFSWDILLMDSDFHDILNMDKEKVNDDKDIYIGNKVWIGCRSTILKGSKIGDNNIVGANSLITSEFIESNVIIAGQPGKILQRNTDWS